MTGMLIRLGEPAEQAKHNRMAPSSMSRTATCVPEVSAAATTSIRNQPFGVLSAASAVPSRICATMSTAACVPTVTTRSPG